MATVATSGCEAADIRRIVREELAALREELANARVSANATPPEPTPESVEALARGHRLIDAALSSRRWTNQDAQMMREILAQLDPAQQKEVLQRLIPAMNRQEIRVSGLMGPPF
ncbi:hypothetical protein ATI61_107518 [Archangium gephyra]|uniref:Uncharacterized protein n=2 Tax=Archangium gephyra TaxID=48 RepID=A0ABX9JZE2_9BACT|nr:hypothetical protein [Archangium gephyra]REG29821.1 hypothetical protein ATI61_107518 [Archangium gephyra]